VPPCSSYENISPKQEAGTAMAKAYPENRTEKCFNITATCIPSRHYMVDISNKIDRIISELIEHDYYFTINRARQYGKTTTLSRLAARLRRDYYVIRISFEGADDLFVSAQNMVNGFLCLTANELQKTDIAPELLTEWTKPVSTPLELVQLSGRITRLCSRADRGIILMIDEVDKCADHELFLSFLGILRDKYIRRADGEDAAFKNVILASVYDIKNLKRKLRPEEAHHYNSPWNIAMDFDVDMSFSAEEISGMLREYEADHGFDLDTVWFGRQLYEYTSGYPYLVSRICQIIDRKVIGEKDFPDTKAAWSPEGFLKAVKILLTTQCTLFDDMNKNLELYPELDKMMRDMLLQGISYPYTISDDMTQLGVQFGYFKQDGSNLAISNRIFETYLYDRYFMQEKFKNDLTKKGDLERSIFFSNGQLDMDCVVERFKAHYDFLYSGQNWNFVEENGRFLFLTFLKPIINGAGNYYIEARTRNQTRTDIVVDYLGRQYIVELKIYHGNAYQQKGIEQLCQYLDSYGQEKGWLISFCFHKKKEKKTGITLLHEKGKTIMEAIL